MVTIKPAKLYLLTLHERIEGAKLLRDAKRIVRHWKRLEALPDIIPARDLSLALSSSLKATQARQQRVAGTDTGLKHRTAPVREFSLASSTATAERALVAESRVIGREFQRQRIDGIRAADNLIDGTAGQALLVASLGNHAHAAEILDVLLQKVDGLDAGEGFESSDAEGFDVDAAAEWALTIEDAGDYMPARENGEWRPDQSRPSSAAFMTCAIYNVASSASWQGKANRDVSGMPLLPSGAPKRIKIAPRGKLAFASRSFDPVAFKRHCDLQSKRIARHGIEWCWCPATGKVLSRAHALAAEALTRDAQHSAQTRSAHAATVSATIARRRESRQTRAAKRMARFANK